MNRDARAAASAARRTSIALPGLLLRLDLLALLLTSLPAAAPEALHQAARKAELASDQGWLRLGHYRPTAAGGLKSQADGAAFFLATDGKTDPAAELRATLDALFAAPAGPGPHDDHARCRFPARAAWLSRRLGIDERQLPLVRCAKRDEFVARVAARSVTYSFSSYYLGNPSSVFGHTFLRLNKDERMPDGERKELLDWGINYAGEPDTKNPILYVVKGMTGGFKGSWLHMPYYYKVREYNDFESRDLWEYRLRLSPEEVRMLVLHLWELGGTSFDYFYIDENCAWHLLAALEAAAPRLELLRHLKVGVLPGDSVKALFANEGLVAGVAYRPSLRSQFEERVAGMDAAELRLVKRLEADPALPLPARGTQEQARILDAAADYLDLVHARALVFEPNPEAAPRRHALLVRRSRLGVLPAPPEPPVPESLAPHRGHASSRIAIGGGTSSARGPFATWAVRLLLHDLADPPDGYPAHTTMETAHLQARFDLRTHRLFLEDAQLLRIVNVAPFTAFEPRAAWRFQLGAQTLRDGGCDACLAGVAEGGGGVGVEPFGPRLLLFAFGDAQLAAAPGLRGLLGTALRPSIGPSAGVRWRAAERYTTLFTAGAWLHFEDRPRSSFWLSWTHRLQLSDAFALEVRLRRSGEGVDASAGALVYY